MAKLSSLATNARRAMRYHCTVDTAFVQNVSGGGLIVAFGATYIETKRNESRRTDGWGLGVY